MLLKRDHRGDLGGVEEERFLRRAVALAVENAAGGQLPFGAVVVVDSEVVSTGVNTALRDSDPTAHVEVEAVRAAWPDTGDARLGWGDRLLEL
jgi:guanine deaminase